MENHLIIVDKNTSEHLFVDQMDKYVQFFSKEKVKMVMPQRKLVIESLDMTIFFRKENTSLHKFLLGKEFKSVKFINTFPNERIMADVYNRSECIKIEKKSI